MTQLIVNIEQPAMVPIIKKMLGLIDGVTIAKPVKVKGKSKAKNVESEAVPCRRTCRSGGRRK